MKRRYKVMLYTNKDVIQNTQQKKKKKKKNGSEDRDFTLFSFFFSVSIQIHLFGKKSSQSGCLRDGRSHRCSQHGLPFYIKLCF